MTDKKIELRSYQKEQLNFINKKIPGKLGIGIQSPTGSGKTFVILQWIKNHFEKNEDQDETIVLATGFNKLVYQMADEAKKFGLEPIIWIGQGHMACGKKIMERDHLSTFPSINDYQAFSQEYKDHPTNASCLYKCEYKNNCLYTQAKRKLKSFGPKFIITNHSSYIYALQLNSFKPDIAFIDEAHAFASFYESCLKVEISKKEIEYVQGFLSERNPISMLFKRCLEKGMSITPQLFNQIKKNITENSKMNNHSLFRRLETFSNAKPSIDKFIDISNKGMECTQFWSQFEVMQNQITYILFSATLDSFTREMFGIAKQRIYYENKCNTIDYTKSIFMIVPEEEFTIGINKFLIKMNEDNKVKGLVLSTTNKDVTYMQEQKIVEGYKVFININAFLKYTGKCVLVGSRALFQGIDIPNLEFVALNKIPFPNYDAKFKAQSNYLENVAQLNPWTQFTLPMVKNDMNQATGRLWRSPGDYGTVAIMDPRLLDNFEYMTKYIEETRRGIKVEILK